LSFLCSHISAINFHKCDTAFLTHTLPISIHFNCDKCTKPRYAATAITQCLLK
jgi:hypothetical protein